MKSNSGSNISPNDFQLIVDSVLKALREQRDRTRDAVSKNIISINPQVLLIKNPSVYGPYYFETSYIKAPSISFGQARVNQGSVKDTLIVMPYVDSWFTISGGIAGFSMGIYALTAVPKGLSNHTIMYNLRGKASLYKADTTPSAWKQAYRSNVASHLYTDVGELESGS